MTMTTKGVRCGSHPVFVKKANDIEDAIINKVDAMRRAKMGENVKKPDVIPGESQSEYLDRCIPEVLNEPGVDTPEQATAICIHNYQEAQKSFEGAIFGGRSTERSD